MSKDQSESVYLAMNRVWRMPGHFHIKYNFHQFIDLLQVTFLLIP